MSKVEKRRQTLVRWLFDHRFWDNYWEVETIVEEVRDEEGKPYYTLNINPYVHDKCFCLSQDVRELNWSVEDGMRIIVKDEKGGVKLASSQAEFEEWRKAELSKMERKYQYLNRLKWKGKQDGQGVLLKSGEEPLDEPFTVEVYAG